MFSFEIDFIDIQCFIYGLYHIYMYTYVVRLRVSVNKGGGGSELRFSVLLPGIFCVFSDDVIIFGLNSR